MESAAAAVCESESVEPVAVIVAPDIVAAVFEAESVN
jgi:hypothetical protein